MVRRTGHGLARDRKEFDRGLEELDVRPARSRPPRIVEVRTDLSGGLLPGEVENPMPRLSILLPALNEEKGLRAVLKKIPEDSLRRMGFHPIVQLLDGGSTDRTRMVARRHGVSIYVQKGWGKGSALREFIPTLRSDYCVFLDPDATYPPAFIPIFAETLRNGASVVLGSRFKGKIEDGAMSVANRLGNKALTLFASILYRRRVSDVCSGMWGFRTDVLKSLTITAEGFDVEANLFAECARRNLPIVEVPIPYSRRMGIAKLRVRTGFRIAWALLTRRIRAPARIVDADRASWNPLAWFARKG